MARVYRFSYVSHTNRGVQVVNDLHYQTDLGLLTSEPDVSDVLTAIDNHLRTAYRAVCPSTMTIDSAELRELVIPGGPVPVASSLVVNALGTLTESGVTLPDAATCIVKLRSNAAIRSGRSYIALPSPRIVTALNTAGQWTTPYFTAVQTLAALLDDVLTIGPIGSTVDIRPKVYSKLRQLRSESPFTFDMVEAIPRQIPSWRRSRMTAP